MINTFVYFETGSHCVGLAGLELTMLTELILNSSLCFPSARIKGMCHSVQSYLFLFETRSQVSKDGFKFSM